MSGPERAPDELKMRIRALEAERLRPLIDPPLDGYGRLLRDAQSYVDGVCPLQPDENTTEEDPP